MISNTEIREALIELRRSGLIGKREKSAPVMLVIEALDRIRRKQSELAAQRSENVPRIARPPGWWLVSITSWLFTDAAQRDLIEPAIADMRLEVYKALQQGQRVRAKWLECCAYVGLGWAFLEATIKTIRSLWRKTGA
jgi:hypothetical protein